jgi:creatinine amidohydrolase
MEYLHNASNELGDPNDRRLVLLPAGSTEQHGPHLPVGTDAMIATALGEAVSTDRQVLLLPTLWLGYSPHHMSFAGTITLSLSTYVRVLDELVDSLGPNRPMLILNGHGGNIGPLTSFVSESQRVRGHSPRVLTYWDVIAKDIGDFFDAEDCGHACALETSLALHLFPQHVRTDLIPPGIRGQAGPHMFAPRSIVRGDDFRRYDETGVIGTPSKAGPEVGAKLFSLLVKRLKDAVRELTHVEGQETS